MAEEKIILEVDVSGLGQNIAQATSDLNVLKRTYEELTEVTSENTEEMVLRRAQIDAANKAIKQQEGALLRITQAEKALGGSLKSVLKEYDANNKSVDTNRKVLNALTAEYIKADKAGREKLQPTIKKISDTLKEQEGAIGDTRRNVGNYKEAFTDAFTSISSGIPALQGFGKAQQGVNAIMSANPIGGVVTLLMGLVQILQTNSEFADKFTFVLGGVNKAFKFIIDSVVGLFGNLSKLGEFFANPIGSIIKFGKGIANAATEGFRAAEALDDLTEKQAEFNGQAENYKKQAEGLEKTLKDTNKTFNERKKIAGEVADLEIKAAEALIVAKQAELDAEREKTKGTKLNGEERAKLRSLELDLVGLNIDKENALKLKQTRINILLGKEETAAKKAEGKTREELLKEQLKREEELRKQHAQDVSNLQIEFGLTEREKIEDSFSAKQALLNANNSEELALIQVLETKKQEALKKFDDDIIKRNKATMATIASNNATSLDQQVKDEEDAVKNKQAIQTSLLSSAIAVTSAIGDVINQNAENEIAALEDQYNAGLITEEKFNQKTKEIKKEQFKAAKAVSITNAIIQTAMAVISAFNAGASLGPAGVVMGPLMAGIAGALGAVQIGLIASQPMPKFAKGVIGLDGAGTATSDSIDAKLSKGESVVTAKATSRFHRQLAYMEMAVGNKPNYQFGSGRFAGGFIPTGISDGGFVARETMRSSDSASFMTDAIKRGFMLAPSPVLSIVEFQSKQEKRNRSVAISEA